MSHIETYKGFEISVQVPSPFGHQCVANIAGTTNTTAAVFGFRCKVITGSSLNDVVAKSKALIDAHTSGLGG